ncbi:MAG TPA: hypothetical protein VFZ04_02995 [Longimicrobiales bacterium]
MKTLLMFVGVCFGTILIIAGVMALRGDGTDGWLQIGAGVLAVILAATPGLRARNRLR